LKTKDYVRPKVSASKLILADSICVPQLFSETDVFPAERWYEGNRHCCLGSKVRCKSQRPTLSLRSRRQHKARGVSPRMRSWKCPSPRQRATDGTQQTALFPFEVNNHPTLCRPLSRAKDYAAINLGLRSAPPQALCYR